MNRPQPHEYPAWGENYIKQVEGDVMTVLEEQVSSFPDFVNGLAEKADYAYAPGKWTIKELVGHIADTEHILACRMLCFARGEQAGLPGFDEDAYVLNARFKDRSLFHMADEFALRRKANLHLIKSLSEEELDRTGNANGKNMSARAVVYILAGHIIHHVKVIKDRYL